MKRDFATEFVALAREVAAVSPDAGARLSPSCASGTPGRRSASPSGPCHAGARRRAAARQRKPVRVVAADLGVSRATIYRLLKPRKSHAWGELRRPRRVKIGGQQLEATWPASTSQPRPLNSTPTWPPKRRCSPGQEYVINGRKLVRADLAAIQEGHPDLEPARADVEPQRQR